MANSNFRSVSVAPMSDIARVLHVEVESHRSAIRRETELIVRLRPPEMLAHAISDTALEDSADYVNMLIRVVEDCRADLERAVMRRFITQRLVPDAPTTYDEAMWFEWFGQKMLELAAPLLKPDAPTWKAGDE